MTNILTLDEERARAGLERASLADLPPVDDGVDDENLQLPQEELLRLDDGFVLPPELSELRALLVLQAQAHNAENDDDFSSLLIGSGRRDALFLQSERYIALHSVFADGALGHLPRPTHA